jgi:hypothetical protein
MKKILYFLLVIILIALAYGVLHFKILGDSYGKVDMTPNEAYQVMEKANSIVLSGDLDKINHKLSIQADGENVGLFVETGLLDSRFTLQLSKKDLFYIKYYNTHDLSDAVTATTYAIYSSEDEIIGYAQETLIDYLDETKDYAYLFYDKDKKVKSYFLPVLESWDVGSDSWKIYNEQGDVLIEADYTTKFFGKYEVTITSYADNVDLKDKMVLCFEIIHALKNCY